MIQGATTRPDTAILVGQRIVIDPIGVSIALPGVWITGRFPEPKYPFPRTEYSPCVAEQANASRIHVGKAARDLPNNTDIADMEYEAVVDSVLPLTELLAHVGAEGWGRASRCSGDLQARIYVTDTSVGRIMERAGSIGVATAKRFFPPKRSTMSAGAWRVTQLSGFECHGDECWTPTIEFYAQSIGTRAFVLVFMFSPAPTAVRDRDAILASFSRHKPS